MNLRLRLAQLLAPPGADVHDPDETACPSELAVLESVEAYDLWPDPDNRVRLDVTDTARYAEQVGWIRLTSDHEKNLVFQLTDAGEVALRRLRRAAGRPESTTTRSG